MKALPQFSSDEIVGLRPNIDRPSPGLIPLNVALETEAASKAGELAQTLTVMLRGSECRFRCLMCDLWKSTHVSRTEAGAIPAQVQWAISQHPSGPQWIKLYNASNFFAPANLPDQDLPEIAKIVHGFERVIVENHPKLLSNSILRFRDGMGGKLEVAMGLETANPDILRKLNKQMTLNDFRNACEWLQSRNIDVRTFILLRPPGLDESEGIEWCIRSVEFAYAHGVRHISIIPMRSGNGAIEHLAAEGLFEPPRAESLEAALRAVIHLPDAIVTADLWDWQCLSGLDDCGGQAFFRRMHLANLTQSFGTASNLAIDPE